MIPLTDKTDHSTYVADEIRPDLDRVARMQVSVLHDLLHSKKAEFHFPATDLPAIADYALMEKMDAYRAGYDQRSVHDALKANYR